jgi:hypothetical protein
MLITLAMTRGVGLLLGLFFIGVAISRATQ